MNVFYTLNFLSVQIIQYAYNPTRTATICPGCIIQNECDCECVKIKTFFFATLVMFKYSIKCPFITSPARQLLFSTRDSKTLVIFFLFTLNVVFPIFFFWFVCLLYQHLRFTCYTLLFYSFCCFFFAKKLWHILYQRRWRHKRWRPKVFSYFFLVCIYDNIM